MRLIDADALKEYCKEGLIDVLPRYKTDKYKDLAIQITGDFCRDIDEQPTVQAVPQWIPVSERLPEDRRVVLVTAYWHETYQVMMASYFGDGLWWCVPYNNCGEHMQRLNPKAWMPLPKPYESQESEEV